MGKEEIEGSKGIYVNDDIKKKLVELRGWIEKREYEVISLI